MSAGNEIGAKISDGDQAVDTNSDGDNDRDSDGNVYFSIPSVEDSRADIEKNEEGKRDVKQISTITKTRISVRSPKKNEVITGWQRGSSVKRQGFFECLFSCAVNQID